MIEIDHQRYLRAQRAMWYALAVMFLSSAVCNVFDLQIVATSILLGSALVSSVHGASYAADLHRLKLMETKGGRMRS